MSRYLAGLMTGVMLAITTSGTLYAMDKPTIGNALGVLLSDRELGRDERLLVAQAFINDCRDMSSRIPALSPREDDWVDSEIAAGRIETLYKSVEFSKRQAKRTFQDCEQTALSLERAISIKDSREVYSWALLLSAILNWTLEDHIRNLSRARSAQITEKDLTMVQMLDMISALIVRKILVPSLRRADETSESRP